MNDIERNLELNESWNIKNAKTKEYQNIRDSINKDNNRSYGNNVSDCEIKNHKDNFGDLSWLKK